MKMIHDAMGEIKKKKEATASEINQDLGDQFFL
jgi:tetrahydromethanopterin S-methyltransferase subunit G